MGKGMPNSYKSSQPHKSESCNGEEHVDIYTYDEKGDVINKKHILTKLWEWVGGSSDDDTGGWDR